LSGSRRGQPCSTCGHLARLQGERRRAGDHGRNIAQLEFRPPTNGFDVLAAAAIDLAAVQRGWLDFRIAQWSFERADPRCQKIGREVIVAIAREEQRRL
jgi:hypothetical protein